MELESYAVAEEEEEENDEMLNALDDENEEGLLTLGVKEDVVLALCGYSKEVFNGAETVAIAGTEETAGIGNFDVSMISSVESGRGEGLVPRFFTFTLTVLSLFAGIGGGGGGSIVTSISEAWLVSRCRRNAQGFTTLLQWSHLINENFSTSGHTPYNPISSIASFVTLVEHGRGGGATINKRFHILTWIGVEINYFNC